MREWHVGDVLSCSKTIAEADVETYSRLCGDFGPLHHDEAYARSGPFGRRIVPGLLTVSVLSAVVSQQLSDFILTSQSLTYVRPVFIDDTVTATATIVAYDPETGRMTMDAGYQNQWDEEVIFGRFQLLAARRIHGLARVMGAFRRR